MALAIKSSIGTICFIASNLFSSRKSQAQNGLQLCFVFLSYLPSNAGGGGGTEKLVLELVCVVSFET